MPPKEKPSKKNQVKKKDQAIEDRTFGLKNKNKSAKVQGFIQHVQKSVKNSNGDPAKAKEDKKNVQLAKKLKDEELRLLFNDGIANQFGKKKSTAAETAKAMGVTEQLLNVEELDLGDSDESDDESIEEEQEGPYSAVSADTEAVEVFKEKTIEDIIEEQRAKLAAEGKKGTPVTETSFATWRAGKLQKRQEEAEARVKAEQAKKKGGKGLSVLSGKELFSFNADLFVDDAGAIDQSEENAFNLESKARQEEEDRRMAAEHARAQEEQNRLAEVQRLEMEARKHKEELRRAAVRARHSTFTVDGVVINEPVFDIDDDEDLSPFDDTDAVQLAVDEGLFEEEDDEEGDDEKQSDGEPEEEERMEKS